MIVQALNEIQGRCGFLPEDEMRGLSRRIGVPLHRLHEVASFFPLYRLRPPPAVVVKVCRDMACHLRGAARLTAGLDALAKEIGGDPPQVVVDGVSCLGQCDHAPAVELNDRVYWGKSEAQLREMVQAGVAREPLPHQHADRAPLGWRIDPYQGQPRYDAVRKLAEGRDIDGLLKTLEAANLRGMGGAGFPTFRKWSAVRGAPGEEKYVVCNGDESEPGTFKDRELLRRTPHLLVEGMVLAGLVTGATRGYIYIRHEFHEEIGAMEEALVKAREMGACGEDIFGSGLSFPVEVYVSPGGYICGEESALLEAMEDRRAEPRNKPPFPVFSGLYNKPTVINNVETLCWTPGIALNGGEWYRDQGARGATGMRFVSISGDVARPGVFEVPFGQTVGELIEMAGGMREGQKLKAIAPSGPSSGFLPAVLHAGFLPPVKWPNEQAIREKVFAGRPTLDINDLPLDSATLGAVGSMLGAAFVAYGDRACVVDNALNTTRFFRNESCGKCWPCRVGSQKLTDMLDAITKGKFKREGLEVTHDLAETMVATSICGLGQVVPGAITSVMAHFRDELDEHINDRRCQAGVCLLS